MNYYKASLLFVCRPITLSLLMLVLGKDTLAQICADPANVIYGLTNSGTIHPITVSSGAVAAQLNPLTGNAPVSSNGIGYCPLNGKFYYFKRMPGSAPQEFVSFDPATNTTVILANCPTINYVYVGGINPAGTGYYCWDSNATLFYYRISTNTWVTITSVLVDGSGNDVDAIIRSHGSGDLAIDGLGNMLMLPSSNSKMALYRMNSPLPVAPVASITVTELMPLTNPPAKFGGIALNASGQIFLNATTPSNGLYRLEQNMSMTFLSTVSSGMGDLTSCNFPFGVLASGLSGFKASLSDFNNVLLTWKNNEQLPNTIIEHSTDHKKWIKISEVSSRTYNTSEMRYIHSEPSIGMNYYRLYYTNENQTKIYSVIRSAEIKNFALISISPNPAHSLITVSSDNIIFANARVTIINQSGRCVVSSTLQNGRTSIPINDLPSGNYLLLIYQRTRAVKVSKFVKH